MISARKLKNDLNKLAALDADIARELPIYGHPRPRSRPVGFDAFLRIIVSQQISTEAAASIYSRVVETVGTVDAASVARCRVDRLRKAGLSARKVEYAKGLAQAVLDGSFDPEALPAMHDDEAVQRISSLRGFGIWSAEIYLMFSLGRRDIFPADDLAVRQALTRLKSPKKPFTPKQARLATAHWSPYRSAGSIFLWHFYRGEPL